MRKTPAQARSKDLVRCVLEACARMHLAGEHWSIAELAKVAGVGVGSVYDYFYDIDDVTQTLAEHRLCETLNQLTEVVEQDRDGSGAGWLLPTLDRLCELRSLPRPVRELLPKAAIGAPCADAGRRLYRVLGRATSVRPNAG